MNLVKKMSSHNPYFTEKRNRVIELHLAGVPNKEIMRLTCSSKGTVAAQIWRYKKELTGEQYFNEKHSGDWVVGN